MAIAAGLGIQWLVQRAASRRSPMGTPSVAAATAIVLTSATAFAANWHPTTAGITIADDYVENLFSTIAPNGLMLTHWQVASPMRTCKK